MAIPESLRLRLAEISARKAEAVARKSESEALAQRARTARFVNKKESAAFKKAASARKGLFKRLINPAIMSEEQFMGTAPQRSSGQGRGRPYGSFKPKVLPSGQVVNMPVQAYKRAVSMQKAQMRMQAELAKARMSMQPAPQEMPQGYGYPDAEDTFLNTEDQSAMQQMQMQQMMAQQQAQQQVAGVQPSRFNIANMFRRPQQMPGSEMRFEQRPPMSPGTGQTVQRLNIWGGPAQSDPRDNILNARNVFNNPGEATIGVARRPQLY